MTGVIYRTKHIHSISHIHDRYRTDRRSETHHTNADENALIKLAYDELSPADKNNINDNINILMQMRAMGYTSAMELLFKLGRFMNENPGFIEAMNETPQS